MSKTNLGLVQHCEKALKEKWYYLWGTHGQKATVSVIDAIIRQYPNEERWRSYANGAVGKTRFADCYGLVKAYLWWTDDNSNPKYNSSQDINTNSAYNKSIFKGVITTMPDVPGIILYMVGHVGVYLGAGRFCECTGGGIGMREGKISNGKIVSGSRFTNWFRDIAIEYQLPNKQNTEQISDKDKEIYDTKLTQIQSKNDLINTFVNLGVINTPEYWKNIDIKYLEELLNKSLPQMHKKINNGITNLDIAIETLVNAGIINTEAYWREQIKSVKYVDQLLINLSNKCRNILDRIVEAEASDQPDQKARELVANVIFNRVKGKGFPNTVYEVIFQKGQFAPIIDGGYKKAKPSALTQKAVDAVLDGKDESMGARYFRMIRGAEGGWHEINLRKLFDYPINNVNGHRFYTEK